MIDHQRYKSDCKTSVREEAGKIIGEHCLLSQRQLKKNSLWGMVRSISTTLLFLISYPIYIRYLGLEIFGVWVILMALETYLQLGLLNLPQAATKYVSESLVQTNQYRVRQVSTSLLVLVVLLGGLIIFLTGLSGSKLSGFLLVPPELRLQLPLLIYLTGVITAQVMLTETLGGIVTGTGRIDLVFIGDILCRGLILLMSWLLLIHHYGIMALFYSSMLGYCLYGTMLTVFLKRSLGFLPFGFRYLSRNCLKQAFRYSGPLLLGSVLACLLQPFNRILLGQIISPSAASIYDIAMRGAQMLRGLVETGLRPLMPQISGLKALAHDEQIQPLTLKFFEAILVWVTPLFIISFLTVDYLLPLWLRSVNTSEISTNFRILLWGFYANLLIVPIYYAFMGIGQVKKCLRAHFVQTVVNLVFATLGIITVEQIWVVSLAASVGMIISFLDLTLIFAADRVGLKELIHLTVKKVSLPVLMFVPLVFLRGNFYFFITFLVIAAMTYMVQIQRSRKKRAS